MFTVMLASQSFLMKIPEWLGAESSTILAWFLLASGLLLLMSGAPGLWRWRRRRGAMPEAKSAAMKARGRSEVDRLAHDLHEMTRLCAAQIDRRAAKIEALLERADVAIARMEEIACDLDQSGAEPRIGTRRVRHGSQLRRGEANDTDPLAREIYQLSDSGKNPVEIAGALEEQVGKVELILALRA